MRAMKKIGMIVVLAALCWMAACVRTAPSPSQEVRPPTPSSSSDIPTPTLAAYTKSAPMTDIVPLAAAPVADPPAPASPPAAWVWDVLASDVAMNALLGLLGLLLSALLAWLAKRGVDVSKARRIVEFVEMGVRETYVSFVRERKRINPSGKLTEDERRQAMDAAVAAAKDYARREGFDLVKQVGKDYLPVLIDAVVRRMKGSPVPFA